MSTGELTVHTGVLHMKPMGIRSYGPGKFTHLIDSFAWDLAMEWSADWECSDPNGGEWYGFVELNAPERARLREIALESGQGLVQDEEEFLDDSVAIILRERTDGIVEATWYDDAAEAAKDWAKVEEEFQEEADDGQAHDGS